MLSTSFNAGVSLQALMALLGHVSAEMSLRYGRLFDATVRDEYQRALAQAKAQLGAVFPGDRTQLPVAALTSGNWRDAPLIKSRHAGGVNFAFVDGSVRFVSQFINQETYTYLSTRNDNRVVPDFDD